MGLAGHRHEEYRKNPLLADPQTQRGPPEGDPQRAGDRSLNQARSTFSTAISIFSIAIAELSASMSGTFHLQGQPSKKL